MKAARANRVAFSLLFLALVSCHSARASTSVSIADFGGVGDGTTDNRAAIIAAFSSLESSGGGTLIIPSGDYRIVCGTASLVVPKNITIEGAPGKSILDFDTDQAGGPGSFRQPLRNGGNNITFDGLIIRRATDYPCVLITVDGHNNFVLKDCTVTGARPTKDPYIVHGLEIGDNKGLTKGLHLTNCLFTSLTYPLFEPNTGCGTVVNTTVDHCTFTGNSADDLEFNSPNATCLDTTVTDCTFSNNFGSGLGAGFAVGFAHCSGGSITNCHITGYNGEGIHLEDYCSDITISGNILKACGLRHGSYIQIIAGCNNITVTGNTLDASGNTNTIQLINAQAGGAGTTAGGRPMVSPSNVTITDNVLTCSSQQNGMYVENVTGVVVSGNHISRTIGSTAAGFGINFTYSPNNGTSDNVISGFGQPIESKF